MKKPKQSPSRAARLRFDVSPQEEADVKTALRIGEQWGYGNLIAHLARAWAERLIDGGLDPKEAVKFGGGRCYTPRPKNKRHLLFP